MRIVFLNPSGELGGAETALLDLLTALRTVRPAWTLALIASADGPLVARAARLNIHSVPLTFPPSLARLGEWGRRGSAAGRVRMGAMLGAAALPTLGYASRLKRELAAFAPHIVHSNGLKMHVLGARVRPAGASLIWHLHDYPGARPLTASLLTRHVHHCAAVLANSHSVADETRQLFGAGAPVHTLYNSIDLERFAPQGPTLDLDGLGTLPPPAPGTLRIGLVATFARWKGHDVFLDAISRLRCARPLRAYIIGAPIYTTGNSQFTLDELKQRVSARGLTDIVTFTGRIEDVAPALRALDIVVHASTEREPFGLVIAEAMACGRPIVVSSCGGAAEIARAIALFHTPGNAAELAQRLDELAGDANLRASIGQSGCNAARRLFSRQHLVETLVPIYETLVARSHARESTARP